MFILTLAQHAYMHSIDAFLCSLPKEKFKEIADNRNKDDTFNVSVNINGVELTEDEVLKSLEDMFIKLTETYRKRLNNMILKEKDFLKHKYSSVEKEVNKQVKAKLNSNATLIADNALSQLGKIQKEITKLRNTVTNHSLK